MNWRALNSNEVLPTTNFQCLFTYLPNNCHIQKKLVSQNWNFDPRHEFVCSKFDQKICWSDFDKVLQNIAIFSNIVYLFLNWNFNANFALWWLSSKDTFFVTEKKIVEWKLHLFDKFLLYHHIIFFHNGLMPFFQPTSEQQGCHFEYFYWNIG